MLGLQKYYIYNVNNKPTLTFYMPVNKIKICKTTNSELNKK